MAVELFKLKVIAETITNTDTNPEVEKFFYKFDTSHRTNGTITIPANAAGESIHIICEITDNGTPVLTGYRRVVIIPK